MTLAALVANIPKFIIMAILTAISGTISASETALFALNRQQLNRYRSLKSAWAATIVRLRENPADLLATVLLSNTTINILLYSMLGLTVAELSGGSAIWASVLGIAAFLLVLVFAEILPKLIALTLSDRIAPVVAYPLRALEVVSAPIRWLMNLAFIEPLTRIFTPTLSANIDEDDLQRLINISRNEGLLGDAENVLLHQMLDLKHLRVSSLMTPRVDVVAFDLADSREHLVRLLKTHRLMRMPVYEEEIDHMRGVVSAREILMNPETPVAQLLRPVHFIPEQAGSEALLKHFRDTQTQFAVVVDEYGGLAGVIALEDVVEAIVGDLRAPEEKSDLPLIERTDDTHYIVDAGMGVGDFCQAFELPEEESRIHTVGGLIAEMLDRLPEPGDEVVMGHATLRVLSMRRRRIVRVLVELSRPIRDNPDLTILLKQSERLVEPILPIDPTPPGGEGAR